ncbi:MAG TPA: SurA N-terminal domain-containing protein [Desulfobacterales bacterium]|nr:SurA N-terminal domain-containing protein [Desulfobacterales bacterium]
MLDGFVNSPISALRFILFAALVGGLFAPLPAPAAQTAIVDRIVAVVNDDIITQHDVETAIRPFLENTKDQGFSPEMQRQAMARLRKDALDTLIENKLTDQEVKRYNITVSEEEIGQQIAQIKRANSVTDEEIRAMLASRKMSMADYRKDIKGMLQRTKLVNREVTSRVVITKEEIKAYYEKNLAKYGGSRKYHLWNLFAKLPRNASLAERQEAQALLQAALAEINQGRPFEDIARASGAGAGGLQGADLGLYRVEELTPQLREVVKNMAAGAVSPIVESEFGYQVVFVQQIVETAGRPLAEVESEIQETLYREIVDGKIKAWITDLRRRSHIKIMEAK